MIDFEISSYGSFYTIDPMNSESSDWISSILREPTAWGNGFVVDNFGIDDILGAMHDEGYTHFMNDKTKLFSEV